MRNHPQFWPYVALICVCVFWGTTYIGFRFALESFPPFTLVGVRNTISAALLLTWAFSTKKRFPKGRDLWITSGLGVMVIGVGNVAVALAEQWVTTGLVSLFVTTSPFWYVGLDSLVPGGVKLHGPTLAGLLVGFAGVLILVSPAALETIETHSFASGGAILIGFLIMQFSGASWSLGSILQRNRRLEIHPFVVAGVQQLAAAVACGFAGLFETRPVELTTGGVLGVVYLAVFGGVVGFGSYMVALTRLPLAVVSIYTYVNPVVALFLGWFFLGESVGMLELVAMAVIFSGIYLVRRATQREKARAIESERRAAESSG